MKILSALRLDRWQDEDDPTRDWFQRLVAREEYVTQEAGPTLYSSDYTRNPHYEVGHVTTWLHWGLGLDVESMPWAGDLHDKNFESAIDVKLMVGPFTLWATRRSCPNRPNVFEPWTSRTATPSPSGSSSGSS